MLSSCTTQCSHLTFLQWSLFTGIALVCPHDHDDLERGASIVMINGVPHWIEPAYLDPTQTPRLNTAHHLPRILSA